MCVCVENGQERALRRCLLVSNLAQDLGAHEGGIVGGGVKRRGVFVEPRVLWGGLET